MLFHGSTIDVDIVDGVSDFSNYDTWKPCGSTLVGIDFNINLVSGVVFTTTSAVLSIES